LKRYLNINKSIFHRTYVILIPVIMLLTALLSSVNLYAAQSIITESDGSACMTQGKTKAQVETEALAVASENAKQSAVQYLKAQGWQDQGLLSRYERGAINVVEELEKGWEGKSSSSQCYKTRLRVEVVALEAPRTGATRGVAVVAKTNELVSSGPLDVQLFTDKGSYAKGEKIRIYLKGNKSFYARVVYRDAGGNVIQLLPNPYRQDNYFRAGITHEIPSTNDRFDLEVSPPFGTEDIVLFASTSPLGNVDVQPAGAVYEIKVAYTEIGIKTRGIGGTRQGMGTEKPSMAQANRPAINTGGSNEPRLQSATAEFAETKANIRTMK
jgi:hypothetical protein